VGSGQWAVGSGQEAGGRRQEAGGRRQEAVLGAWCLVLGGAPSEKIWFRPLSLSRMRPLDVMRIEGEGLGEGSATRSAFSAAWVQDHVEQGQRDRLPQLAAAVGFQQTLLGSISGPERFPLFVAPGRRYPQLPGNGFARLMTFRADDGLNRLRSAIRLATRHARPGSVAHSRLGKESFLTPLPSSVCDEATTAVHHVMSGWLEGVDIRIVKARLQTAQCFLHGYLADGVRKLLGPR
jgi:hypothetical protein